MPTPLLGVADYPEVRASLDVALSAALVPDAILGMPIYVPGAIADVLAIVPDAETRTGAEGDAVHRAAVYFAGYRLAAAVTALVREAFGDVSVQRHDADYAARGDELLVLARAELVAVGGVVGATGTSVPIFTLAGAGRPLVAASRRGQGTSWWSW